VALVIGLIWDSSMSRLGWIAYAEPGPLPGIAPVWILALWALFAMVLREPLRWLHKRLPLAALLGALGGPLSYAAAERLGACRLVEPIAAGVRARVRLGRDHAAAAGAGAALGCTTADHALE
jgi:hypothetical protein